MNAVVVLGLLAAIGYIAVCGTSGSADTSGSSATTSTAERLAQPAKELPSSGLQALLDRMDAPDTIPTAA